MVVSLLLDSLCQLKQQQSCLFYHRGDSTVSVWMETQVNNVVVLYLLCIKSLQDMIPGMLLDTRKVDSYLCSGGVIIDVTGKELLFHTVWFKYITIKHINFV